MAKIINGRSFFMKIGRKLKKKEVSSDRLKENHYLCAGILSGIWILKKLSMIILLCVKNNRIT